MQRKLVQQGTTTLMISLPSDYVKRFNLQKGQEIDILDAKDHLILAAAKQKDKKEIVLTFTSLSESAIRLTLINAYRAGYDVLKIKNASKKQYEIIKEVLQNYLLGVEITREEKGICILGNIAEPHKENFDTLFQKIFNNINLMIQGTRERLKENIRFDYQFLMLNTHRYDNFCRRIMAKENLYSDKAIFFWNFLSLVIHSPRELYHLNKYLDAKKPVISPRERKDLISYLDFLEQLFSLLREAYHRKDIASIEQIHQRARKILFVDIYNAMEKGKNQIAFYHLSAAMRMLYLSTSPLIGLLLKKE